ncbi:ubiquitin carboxyl-terminal hydrolase 34-like protein [Leptotrombidium deliense]|uniref:Ubiquitin carboxyl-terminal hydrolase 34-like protein n=1 Tax=Leptotrombidium deliense TaxID=299467 RepID=A0A443S0D3_9ACAR|nr:ubiquitin carboxyl-terminal hydrolase 34-like protein [Leptotrombidium deliense]
MSLAICPRFQIKIFAFRRIEIWWSVIIDPLDPRCVIDKEGLALALKYFTSSTLTMHLAGIAQINNYISLFNEFCQTEGGITPRQADGEELVDWILSNKMIEHIFGPNHCSRQVLDILTPVIKNMSVPTVLYLYALIRKMEPKGSH